MSSTGWGRQTSPDFIEETVELELGAEVDQSLVTERLQRPVGYHGTHQLGTNITSVSLG